jgi:hypothetical protein
MAPITALDGKPVGNGKPGEVTKSVFKSYLNEVRKLPKPISHEHSTQIPIEISPS